MKIYIITFLLLYTAIAGAEENLSLPSDIKPFFVHKTIKNAWNKPTHDGIYGYVIDIKGVAGPFVSIYIVEDGKVIDKISQGSNGRHLMERIRKIGLTNFDYHNEIEQTIKKLEREYEKKGKKYYPPVVLDGHTYEINYELDDVNIKFKASNPGHKIYKLADHNENIGKLYSVYKELMLYYAERKFHFK